MDVLFVLVIILLLKMMTILTKYHDDASSQSYSWPRNQVTSILPVCVEPSIQVSEVRSDKCRFTLAVDPGLYPVDADDWVPQEKLVTSRYQDGLRMTSQILEYSTGNRVH